MTNPKPIMNRTGLRRLTNGTGFWWPSLLVVLALIAVACNGTAEPSETTPQTTTPQTTAAESEDEDTVTTAGAPEVVEPEIKDLKIGIIPVGALTPVWLAEQSGYFADEGFSSVEFTFSFNSPEMLALAVSGDLHFAHSTYQSGLQALQGGFDVVAVENSDASSDGSLHDGRRDVHGLLVLEDSPITRPRDLEGRTVGVSTVPGLIWMFTVEVIERDGGDPDLVNFVEVPFPSMADALLSGQVDAAGPLEPFITVALESGARGIAWPYVDVFGRELDLGGLVAARSFAEENPITVWKVVNAIQRAMDDMARDEEFARAKIVEFTEMDETLAQQMWIAPLNTQVDPEAVQLQHDLMLKLGMLDAPVDFEDYLWETLFEYCPIDICFYPEGTGPEDHEDGVTMRP